MPQQDIQVIDCKLQPTKSGRVFTKVTALFPDGGKYRCTIFDRMEIAPGTTISANVEPDAPYNGNPQFKLNQPIFIHGGAPAAPAPGTMAPVSSPHAVPAPLPLANTGYKPKAVMSYNQYIDMSRRVMDDAYVIVSEIAARKEMVVSADTLLAEAMDRGTSTLIAILRGEVEGPDMEIPF